MPRKTEFEPSHSDDRASEIDELDFVNAHQIIILHPVVTFERFCRIIELKYDLSGQVVLFLRKFNKLFGAR